MKKTFTGKTRLFLCISGAIIVVALIIGVLVVGLVGVLVVGLVGVLVVGRVVGVGAGFVALVA